MKNTSKPELNNRSTTKMASLESRVPEAHRMKRLLRNVCEIFRIPPTAHEARVGSPPTFTLKVKLNE